MQKIIPNLWFQGDAEEAGEFYAAALPRTTATTTMRYPRDGLLDFQKPLAGEPLTVEVDIDGYTLVLINAGAEFRPNPSISFLLDFDGSQDPDARAHLDETWARLSDGAEILMPLDAYPYSERYGWLQDRYGVSWQLVLTDHPGSPQPFVTPSLTFGAAAQSRAREAVEFYTATLPDARLTSIAEYPEPDAHMRPGDVSFATFQLGGQTFSAMDSSVPQEESFTPGVSLQVACADQSEIDRLWDALSSVPEAEQCGWCVDRFGVSWQIVPERIGELVASPAGYRAMLEMKKLVIADLEAAS